ncbi:hypothetical protein [Gemmatimonas sp.]|uniref:hypothetical protein n=1 Tax=Gemmatimonas sp. TaxID=1962908 RepID=UPI00286E4B4D|nr:hypothetical protein [Gemmatimonas sp.]
MTENEIPSTVTREELYARVWAEPMQRVAASIGISDVALKKRCTKLFIPVPPRGYWAKKAAGKPTRVTKLPPWNAAKHGTLYTADFGPVRPVSAEMKLHRSAD